MMKVILTAPRIPSPGAAAEDGQPIVRRTAVGGGIGPDIPVGFGAVMRRATFLEPGMIDRGMAPNQVDDHFEAERVGACDDGVEISQRSKPWVDTSVIGDVIAEIPHRRWVERRNPDAVDAERRYVVEAAQQSRKVAESIVIAVAEAR